MKPYVNYSLYLVTDSTEAILGKKNLVQVVEQAILGGATIIQYREKNLETRALIATARQLHAVCRAYNVPLIINDRVDVALAIDCEGVHLGQDDMPVSRARSLLGPDKIIGATVCSIEEARAAVEQDADYLGIGTLYTTQTKQNTKEIIGVKGIREILHYLGNADEAFRLVGTVCIGGVNAKNVQRVIYQLSAPAETQKRIDGVAVVSAIIAASDPRAAASTLKSLITSHPPWFTSPQSIPSCSDLTNPSTSPLLSALRALHKASPLTHNMTNLVVQNIAANVALSIGASPIMSNNGAEAADLARLGGALVINMGTATPEALVQHRLAIEAYNAVGGPIVLDPVGAGATTARKEALRTLLAAGYFDLIKGNEAEIIEVARASGLQVNGTSVQQRGVDSSASGMSVANKATLVARLAWRERNIVLMTGVVDLLSDGRTTFTIHNGHEYLGMMTGSGCTLGTTLSAYLAAYRQQDKLMAALAGVLHFEIAAEYAAEREDVKGPGTFVPAFIDELYARRMDGVEGSGQWLEKARIVRVEVEL